MRRAGVPWTGQELAALRDATGKEIEDFYTAETPQVLVPAPVQRHCLITAISSNYFQLLGGAAACAAGGMAGGLPICLALSKLASALRHSREITRVCSRRVTTGQTGPGMIMPCPSAAYGPRSGPGGGQLYRSTSGQVLVSAEAPALLPDRGAAIRAIPRRSIKEQTAMQGLDAWSNPQRIIGRTLLILY